MNITNGYACDLETERRHKESNDMLEESVEYLSPMQLFSRLGLFSSYREFRDAAFVNIYPVLESTSDGVAMGLFDDIASMAPTILNNNLQYPEKTYKHMLEAGLFEELERSSALSGSALIAHFAWLWKRMQSTNKSSWPRVKQTTKLAYFERENRPVSDSSFKTVGVFYFKSSTSKNFKAAHIALKLRRNVIDGYLPPSVLREIGDYVVHVWTEQITRVFVPVLLLHGGMMSLVVFTRKGVMVASLGPIVLSAKHTASRNVANTLRILWFVLTLDATEFGHICEIQGDYLGVSFSKPKEDGTTKIELVKKNKGRMIAGIQSRIECSVRILSQASYIYRTTYEGKDAVLKLAWMPTSLLPEGAAYQLLKNKCKDLIPEVYASGVVEQDRFGYRLDFMVIEHCGETIGELARKHYDNQEEFEAIVCSAISQASACIAKAYSAGVIHRDISTGNIAIKNGKTKVIDWGLARLLDNVEIDGISDVEEAWYFRRYIISTTQAMSSLIIGTPLFMSIQTLLGTRSRGLMDDIESMFYVALYALGVFYETIDAYSLLCGFQCNDEETKSVSRLGCLMDKDAYLEQFGILHCQEATTAVLNSMYKFLFYEKDINIAGRLLGDKDRERHVNIDFARGFMDASLLLPDVAPNPPLRAQKIRRVQTQSMTINDRAGDEGCIAKRTRSRTRHVKK